MSKNNPSWIEKLDPAYLKPKPGKKDTGQVDCHTPDSEKGDPCPFIFQTDGSIQVKRKVILKAMEESGFTRTASCCDPELEKMCAGDQYQGNLEGFANRLMKLIGVSPST